MGGAKRSVTGFRAAQEAAQEATTEPAIAKLPEAKQTVEQNASNEQSSAQISETPASVSVDALSWTKQIENDMECIQKELSSSTGLDTQQEHKMERINQQSSTPNEPRALPLSALLGNSSVELPSAPSEELEVILDMIATQDI